MSKPTYRVIGGDTIEVNVSIPEIRDLLMELPSKLSIPDITVQAPPEREIHVHVPEANFHVPVPEVHIKPPNVHVEAPIINIPQAHVVLNQDPQQINMLVEIFKEKEIKKIVKGLGLLLCMQALCLVLAFGSVAYNYFLIYTENK